MRPLTSQILLTPEQMHLLDACAHHIALALEADQAQEEVKNIDSRNDRGEN